MIRTIKILVVVVLLASCSRDPNEEANRQAVMAARSLKDILERDVTALFEKPLLQLTKERDVLVAALTTVDTIKEKYPQAQAAVALSGDGRYAGLDLEAMRTRLLFYPGGPSHVLGQEWVPMFSGNISLLEVAWAYSKTLGLYLQTLKRDTIDANQIAHFPSCFATKLRIAQAELAVRHWMELPEIMDAEPTFAFGDILAGHRVSMQIKKTDKGDLMAFLNWLASERAFNPYNSQPSDAAWDRWEASAENHALNSATNVTAWRTSAHHASEWANSVKSSKEQPFLKENAWLNRAPKQLSALWMACLR